MNIADPRDAYHTFVPTQVRRPKPPSSQAYRVGIGQVDDMGYLFEWAADPEAAPHLRRLSRCASVGREWMRKNAPKQWAEFCAARIEDRIQIRLVGDAFETTPFILEEDLEWEQTVA